MKKENSHLREEDEFNQFSALTTIANFQAHLYKENKMTHTFRAIAIALAAMIAFLPLAATTPVWAAGSNSTSPAPAPATPTAVVTSSPALNSVGAGGCAQQYTGAINALNDSAITANDVGLAANAVGAAATVTGLIAQEVASTASAAAFTAMSVGLGVTVA